MEEKIKTKFKHGLELFKLKNFMRTLEIFKFLEKKEPANMHISYMLALTYCQLDNYPLARTYFHRILQIDDKSFYLVQAHMLLGYIYAKENSFNKSEDHLHEPFSVISIITVMIMRNRSITIRKPYSWIRTMQTVTMASVTII